MALGHSSSWQTAAADLEFAGISADSRLVQPGHLFVALAGAKTDGRRFVDDALARGAAAVLTDPEGATRFDPGFPIPVIADANPRRLLALAAARMAGEQPETVVAVTGTNGKTSTASFTRQIWEAAGLSAASIGTLGVERDGGSAALGMTTPDPIELHAHMAELKRERIDHVALEASSHGLAQYRLDGVRLTAAAFTNLTQDHLDYHGSMAGYLAAKLRLFGEVLAPGGTAVLNADIPEFDACVEACRPARHAVLDFGTRARAIRLVKRHPHESGQTLLLDVLGRGHAVDLPLVGEFQAMNALAALGLALATGVAVDRAVAALVDLTGVRGRVEKVAVLANGAPIFVDYAHTPDGLEKVLSALRPHATRRLFCVFGAGGDRDPTKRARMGEVVARLADCPIVTDDNPRSENPALIRRQVLAGCRHAIEIGDRAQAIDTAVRQLQAGDLLVIAGKGHEQGQQIGAVVLPFDDATVARSSVQSLRERR
jgi:UDP-N-acetylmuramoyl-L-alanyl-D-glutamate--2,6-diaminopimelate ligase